MLPELSALFLSAFLAATIFPAQSELGLAFLIREAPDKIVILIAVASVGNTLGSVVNWVLGREFRGWAAASRLKPAEKHLARAEGWYQRFGYWSLLMSWAPVIGDPITLVAGILREPFWRFLALVAFAKTARYCVVALLVMGLI
ncbi:YqaA family protein [Roseibium sediminis]|uniref:YqaA family protein n=1 Tax=Roseibium sediminis TaxID=1775174 RepID=UPI00123DB4CC|nr:YqaA family protein [Roseibium sediminis]